MKLPESVVISAHFKNSQEVELVKKAARAIGLTPSAFLRQISLEKSSQIADGWDVRQMKKRAKGQLKLRVIEGGKR
jgi:antitoxin component of MazEF toxin-antitoxin module